MFIPKKISKKRPDLTPKPPRKKFKISKKHLKILLVIATVMLFSLSAVATFKHTPIKTIISKNILKTIGTDLKKDSDGFVNILLLGVGGAGHDGAYLTDTIIVASLQPKTDTVVLSSIPRDLYVTNENIISQRINSVYQNSRYRLGDDQAINITKKIISDFLGFKIHYHLLVNFQAATDIVDTLGGIDIYNPKALYDPFYPANNHGYQIFSLPQGYQTLNGSTALKFARSRQTTSDFDRSERQQIILFGLKEKALKLNFLTNFEKLEEIYQTLEKNIFTNLTIREISSLAALATDISQNNVISVIFNNDFNLKGGFLYSPPRSQFLGASVLLPADKTFSQIHTFLKLHRQFPEVMQNPLPIDILNSTKIDGLARNTSQILTRFGFTTNNLTNSNERSNDNIETILEITTDTNKQYIKALQTLFPPIDDLKMIDPIMPDPTKDGLESKMKIIAGTDIQQLLKFYDIYSSVGSIIQQAIAEELAEKTDPSDSELTP